MMKRRGLPKYVSEFQNRHGVWTVRFRRQGWPTVYPKSQPNTDEFAAEYRAWMAGQAHAVGSKRTAPGSFRALAVSYFQTAGNIPNSECLGFLSMKPSTQGVYRNLINRLCDEEGRTGIKIGDMPAAGLQREHIIRLMAARADKPDAANGLRKVLRALMAHAVASGVRRDDPTQGIRPLKAKSKLGFHRWTDEEIARFEARHAIGSKARLAMALGLYTGQARQDVIAMGRQHVRDEVLAWTRLKTEHLTALDLQIPVHPDLRKIIDATPSGHLNFLVTDFGQPFTAAGFGNWFRERCDEANLRHCSFHGLRKAASVRLAEAGCTPHEIAAITGHASLKEVQRYTATADRKRLAASAMAKVKSRTTVG